MWERDSGAPLRAKPFLEAAGGWVISPPAEGRDRCEPGGLVEKQCLGLWFTGAKSEYLLDPNSPGMLLEHG